MATNNSFKRPVTTLRCGNIKATIWQNDSEKGPFFTTTFSRPFKDQSGAWHNGTSFGLNDPETLMNVAVKANQWIIADAVRRCNEKAIKDLELMTSPSQRSPEEVIKQVLKEYGRTS